MAAEMSASKTPEEKKSARDYANVKHAQLALKMLKKEIEAPIKAAEKAKRKEEVAQLFAAGYGQPQFGGAVPEAIAEAEEEQEREELRQIEEESEGLEDDEDFGDDLEEIWEEEPEEDEDFDDEVFEEVLGEEFEE